MTDAEKLVLTLKKAAMDRRLSFAARGVILYLWLSDESDHLADDRHDELFRAFDELTKYGYLEKGEKEQSFKSYAEYLKSDHWQEVRKAALKRANYRCQVCNESVPLDVHHRTYERLGKEDDADVIALCRKCHGLFHGQA